MTKHKWEEIEQLESPTADDGSSSPPLPNQQPGVVPQSSNQVGQPAYVGESGHSDEVALDDTSTAREGRFGPFWALLAQAGYTVWNQSG